jgi:hypothetical protein
MKGTTLRRTQVEKKLLQGQIVDWLPLRAVWLKVLVLVSKLSTTHQWRMTVKNGHSYLSTHALALSARDALSPRYDELL